MINRKIQKVEGYHLRLTIFLLTTCYLLLSTYHLPFTHLHATTGSTGWIIFRKVQSPKPKPITAIVAVRGDLSGVLYNPAILPTVEYKEIFLLGELGFTEDRVAGIVYAHPLKNKHAVSVALLNYDAGKMTLYWIEGGEEREKEVNAQNDILGFVSYGMPVFTKRFNYRLHTGLTVKFATSRIADVKSATAYAVDYGLAYYTANNLAFSFALQNIGITTKFVEKAEKLPASVWFGAGYSKVLKSGKDYYFSVGGDLPYILDESRFTPSIGVEIGKLPFGIFAGYRMNVEEGIFNVGLSFVVEKFDLSYSFIPTTRLSPIHRISFAYRF